MRRLSIWAMAIAVLSPLLVVAIAPSANATPTRSSIWSNGIELTEDTEWAADDRSYEKCERMDVKARMYRPPKDGLLDLKTTPFEHLSPLESEDHNDVCVVRNQHGVMGGGYWLPDGDSSDAIEIVGPNALAVPNTNVHVIREPSWPNLEGSYSSINYNFPAIGSIEVGTKSVRGRHEKVFKKWKITSSATPLVFSDGSRMSTRSWGFSGNGKYAVTALTSGVLIKIDLRTQRIQAFASVNRKAKNWELAISNNGESVLSHDRLRAGVSLHDLSGCTTEYSRGDLPRLLTDVDISGCTSTDVQQDLFTIHPEARSGSTGRLRFAHNSETFTVGVGWRTGDYYPWRKLVFKPKDFTLSSTKGYLAMGDSYSSGEGDTQGGTWYEPGTDEGGDLATFSGRNLCHLSRRSYPYLMAVELGYLTTNGASPPEDGLFHSVACSGAKIHNVVGIIGEKHDEGVREDFTFTDNQYRFSDDIGEFPLGVWQPGTERQVGFIEGSDNDEVDRDPFAPEAVTVGIGGNDSDFDEFIKACASFGTCSYAQPGTDESVQLVEKTAQNKKRLERLYRNIKETAPDTRIYVHGYPVFVEATGGYCAFNVRLDGQERLFAANAMKYMNSIIKAAAAEAGVFYVDVENIFKGHKLCSSIEGDKIVVNGATAGNDIDLGEGTEIFGITINTGVCIRTCIGNESYHPTHEGFELYKDAILAQTNGLKSPMPEPVDTLVPVPDSFFGTVAAHKVRRMNGSAGYPVIRLVSSDNLIADIDLYANAMTLNVTGYLPGSTMKLSVHSDPISLGEYTVDQNGNLNVDVVLPEGLEPGYHLVHAEGVDTVGAGIDTYQSMVLAASPTDFDGDGVPDEEDRCQGLEDAGVDSDEDGTDDGCDSRIVKLAAEEEGDVRDEGQSGFVKGGPSVETVAGTDAELVSRVLGASTAAANSTLPQTGTSQVRQILMGLVLVALPAIMVIGASSGNKRLKANKDQ